MSRMGAGEGAQEYASTRRECDAASAATASAATRHSAGCPAEYPVWHAAEAFGLTGTVFPRRARSSAVNLPSRPCLHKGGLMRIGLSSANGAGTVQARPSINSIDCTAAPDAPLPRLSSLAIRSANGDSSSIPADPDLKKFVPFRLSASSLSIAVGRVERDDANRAPLPVMGAKRRFEIGSRGLPGKEIEMQRHADQHPLPEIAHRGHENRPARQAADKPRFPACACARNRGHRARRKAQFPPSWAAIIALPPPE